MHLERRDEEDKYLGSEECVSCEKKNHNEPNFGTRSTLSSSHSGRKQDERYH